MKNEHGVFTNKGVGTNQLDNKEENYSLKNHYIFKTLILNLLIAKNLNK